MVLKKVKGFAVGGEWEGSVRVETNAVSGTTAMSVLLRINLLKYSSKFGYS